MTTDNVVFVEAAFLGRLLDLEKAYHEAVRLRDNVVAIGANVRQYGSDDLTDFALSDTYGHLSAAITTLENAYESAHEEYSLYARLVRNHFGFHIEVPEKKIPSK